MNAVANNDIASNGLIRFSPNQVPDELLNTDRILLRWAASIGDGSLSSVWEELIRARVTELPWEVAILVDQLIMRAPNGYKQLIVLWYRTPWPREVLADRLHLPKDEIRYTWTCALQHFRRHFESSPLSGLRELALQNIPGRSRAVWDLLTARRTQEDEPS